MSKSKLILSLTLAATIVVLSTPNAQADAEVSGPITSDTTWTAADSPYIVTEDVEVLEGVTLTVEPGVTVKFDSEKKLAVNGDLIAQGAEGNPITFTSNQTRPAPGDWATITFTETATTTMDAEGNYVSGSVLQHCIVEYAGFNSDNAIGARSLLIDHCTVRDNKGRGIYNYGTWTDAGRVTNCTVIDNSNGGIYARFNTVSSNSVIGNHTDRDGGGIDASCSTVTSNTIKSNYALRHGGGINADESTIGDNIISDNHAQVNGGGIYFAAIYYQITTVSDNIISGNSAGNNGGGVYGRANGGSRGSAIISNTISSNTVTGDSSGGAGVYTRGTVDIFYNTITDNSGALNSKTGGVETLQYSDSFRPIPTQRVQYNHIYGNARYDVVVCESSADIDGTYNYWGAKSSQEISERIYDRHDDDSRGEFRYTPYLLGPVGSNHWVYLPVVHYSQ